MQNEKKKLKSNEAPVWVWLMAPTIKIHNTETNHRHRIID